MPPCAWLLSLNKMSTPGDGCCTSKKVRMLTAHDMQSATHAGSVACSEHPIVGFDMLSRLHSLGAQVCGCRRLP